MVSCVTCFPREVRGQVRAGNRSRRCLRGREVGCQGGHLSRVLGAVLRAEERGHLRGREVLPISPAAAKKSLGRGQGKGLISVVQPDPGKNVLQECHLLGSLCVCRGDPEPEVCGGQAAASSAFGGLAVWTRLTLPVVELTGVGLRVQIPSLPLTSCEWCHFLDLGLQFTWSMKCGP